MHVSYHLLNYSPLPFLYLILNSFEDKKMDYKYVHNSIFPLTDEKTVQNVFHGFFLFLLWLNAMKRPATLFKNNIRRNTHKFNENEMDFYQI